MTTPNNGGAAFKVGDRVEVIDASGEEGYYTNGCTGTVERVDSDGDCWVDFDPPALSFCGNRNWCASPWRLRALPVSAAAGGGVLAEVLALLASATPGRWILATSCSWRRIVTDDSRPVIVPCVQRSDGHPDLDAGEDHVNAEAAIAAVNYLRSHGPAIAELIAADREVDAVEGEVRRAELAGPRPYSYGTGWESRDEAARKDRERRREAAHARRRAALSNIEGGQV